MLRKSMIALCAIASFGMLTPDMAPARGGVASVDMLAATLVVVSAKTYLLVL